MVPMAEPRTPTPKLARAREKKTARTGASALLQEGMHGNNANNLRRCLEYAQYSGVPNDELNKAKRILRDLVAAESAETSQEEARKKAQRKFQVEMRKQQRDEPTFARIIEAAEKAGVAD